jgi:hypothetical protein
MLWHKCNECDKVLLLCGFAHINSFYLCSSAQVWLVSPGDFPALRLHLHSLYCKLASVSRGLVQHDVTRPCKPH